MLAIVGVIALLVVGGYCTFRGVQFLIAAFFFAIHYGGRGDFLVFASIMGTGLTTFGGWLIYLACVKVPLTVFYTGVI